MVIDNKVSFNPNEIWDLISSIPDPEIPCITISDLGIIRGIKETDKGAVIQLTPTYSGCPAVSAIEIAVREKLHQNGINAKVERVLSPPWSSDWISKDGKDKLKAYGIAPPTRSINKGNTFFSTETTECPKCNSTDTHMISNFGSTACKAQFSCNYCLEPFELFKCI